MSNPVLITVCTHIKTACTLGQLWIRLWKFCTLYRQQLPNAWGVSKGGTTVFHSHQQHLRVSDFSTSAHPIIAEGSSVFQWLWFAFPWLLKTLSTFLCAYWLSVDLFWRKSSNCFGFWNACRCTCTSVCTGQRLTFMVSLFYWGRVSCPIQSLTIWLV